ncbi:hypothetical protein J5N97_006209 [Dioscorea zingiberensis]|uniref:Reticulon-like protein n=1 Tax=Dioscorea zingiberensis TaxID=325984 RepID=A0A9D5D9S7_9LILI|nr:hypothetical protein J5N97_006209 [Dioscorea zingiberensis]
MASSSPRFLGRQRSLHEILGGGLVADVILWRRRDVSMGLLLGTLAAWVLFELSGYPLLRLVSNVLLLLFSILFVWSKAAGILNRPPPPVPELHISKEFIDEAAILLSSSVNMLLSACYRISLGKDTVLFYRVAACLWLLSLLGGFIDSLTLGYTSLVIFLTVPALYDKYEDYVDGYLIMACVDVQIGYESYEKCFNEVEMWIIEKKKNLPDEETLSLLPHFVPIARLCCWCDLESQSTEGARHLRDHRESEEMSFIGTQQKCKACEKTVYPMDQLMADGIAYHKSCFKCSHCKGTLKLSNFSSMEGVLYCKPHFEQLFKETGNFNKNFQSAVKSAEKLTPELTRSPSKAAGMFSGTQEKCATCGKTAYPLEKVSVEGQAYHKSCFKCSHGGCPISPSNYAALEGILYCKHHFSQLFKEKGSYNHLIKCASMKRTTAAVPDA